MDMEHEIKKDAPSAQQAAGSIDTPSDHECGACNGSGWVVRDEDIGTDQECFSCDGSGRVKDDVHISAAAERGVDYIMSAVQSFASEWSLVGGRFDGGGMLDQANDTKTRIRRMLEDDAAKLAAAQVAQPIAVSAPTERKLLNAAMTFAKEHIEGDALHDDESAADEVVHASDERYNESKRLLCDAYLELMAGGASAVSAPTDERAAFEVWAKVEFVEEYEDLGENMFARIASGQYESMLTRNAWKAFEAGTVAKLGIKYSEQDRNNITDGYALAARAAAPVSGPTCKACNGAGTWIGQHDGYDDADCAVCDGSGKAAPVSGQGASIGDDKEFRRLLENWHSQNKFVVAHESYKSLVAYIDSRPRSEDSRAEVSGDQDEN